MEDSLVYSEIFHSGEGGDVEQWLESRNKSFLFVIALLSLLHLLCLIHLFVDHYSSQ